MTPEIKQLVTDMYTGFMHREPDPGGFEYWCGRIYSAAQVNQSSTSIAIDAMVDSFQTCPEFRNRVDVIIGQAPPDYQPPAGDFDVRGNPVPAPSGPPGASMGEQPGNPPFPGGGGGPCGSYQVNGGWLYILEDRLEGRFGNSIRIAVPYNQAVAFRFFTGGYVDRPLVIASEENTVRGPLTARFITLSEKRFDFDYSKQGTPGYQIMQGGGAIQAIFNPGSPIPGRMSLKPNTNYYLNIKCDDPNLTSGTMGTTIGFS
jgi:hypothetical protein